MHNTLNFWNVSADWILLQVNSDFFELMDSGISINGGHYDQIERLRKNGLDYERIDEIKTMTGKFLLKWYICLCK